MKTTIAIEDREEDFGVFKVIMKYLDITTKII